MNKCPRDPITLSEDDWDVQSPSQHSIWIPLPFSEGYWIPRDGYKWMIWGVLKPLFLVQHPGSSLKPLQFFEAPKNFSRLQLLPTKVIPHMSSGNSVDRGEFNWQNLNESEKKQGSLKVKVE